jgi:hypothetical protein
MGAGTEGTTMATPNGNRGLQKVITFHNGDRVAALVRLLKGKIQINWKQTSGSLEMSRVLLDEAYRQPFDELVALLHHREAVLTSLIHQKTLRPTEVRR